jgi:ribosomal 50S subunit-associated protein YjgA (DUF615 family)
MKMSNSEMRLNRKAIEEIAEKELLKYLGKFVRSERAIRAIDIESFATDYLGLRLIYTRLSNHGEHLGVTTYTDTDIILERYLRTETIRVLKDTILLDESLMESQSWQHDNTGRMRFTVAHECSHQILYRMESEIKRTEHLAKYSNRIITLNEMNKIVDWSEWQANALAAAILMPQRYIEMMLNSRHLTYYGRKLNKTDRIIFDGMCHRLKVSQSAMYHRLKQLGHLQFLSSLEYQDPFDIDYEELQLTV